jgi:uncharacterized protein
VRHLLTIIALAVVVAWPPRQAEAASFDCAKAKTSVEIAICSDPTLSSADEETARLYKQVLASNLAVRAEQIQWLKETRNPCMNTSSGSDSLNSCLSQVYLDRISALQNAISSAGGNPARQAAASTPNASEPDINSISKSSIAVKRYPTSFDCANADTAQAIVCADETLAAADVELEKIVKERSAGDPSVISLQSAWITSVRDKCSTSECLSGVYQQRINELESSTPEAAAASSQTSQDTAEVAAQSTATLAKPVLTPFTTTQKILWGIASIVMIPLGWKVGSSIGKLGKANVVHASNNLELASRRIENALFPFIVGIIGVIGGIYLAYRIAAALGS